MAVDVFTRAEFEAALPKNKLTKDPLWTYSGIVDGEYTYFLPVGNPFQRTLGICIRSSVRGYGGDAVSAASGEDSIRCWLSLGGTPYMNKIKKYVTRVKGWEGRLTELLRLLYRLGNALRPCPTCGMLRKAFMVKKEGPNKGRFFQNCVVGQSHDAFDWIELDTTPKTDPPPKLKPGELPPDFGLGSHGRSDRMREK